MKKSTFSKFLIIFIILILLVLVDSLFFQIKDVKYEGNTKYTNDEMNQYIFNKNFDKNLPVFYLKTKFLSKPEIPFVETYDVEIVSFQKIKITVYEKSVVGYIQYMGTNMYFDKDGIVVESSDRALDGIPYITGLSFDYIVLHEKLPVKNDDVFHLILDVTQLLKKYKIAVNQIYISENQEVSLYLGSVKAEMGMSDNMSDKISDLKDIVPNLEGISGTIDMKTYREDGKYTLKKNSE